MLPSKHSYRQLCFLLTTTILLQSCSIAENAKTTLMRKARSFEYSDEYAKAEEIYKQIDILNPNEASPLHLFILLNESRLYLLMKNYSKAILTCKKGLKLCQSLYGCNDMLNTSFLFVLASAYDEMKKYDEAITIYESIKTFSPYSRCGKDLVEILPLIRLGDIQFKKKNLHSALKLYLEAFAKGRLSKTIGKLISYRLARCYEALGQYTEADIKFKDALPTLSTESAPKNIYDRYSEFLVKFGKPASSGLARRDSLEWYAKHKEYVDWYYPRTGPGSRCRLIDSFTESDYDLVDAMQAKQKTNREY